MNGAGREPRLPAINVNNSRKDRWLCILSIGVLWTLIALPTVFYAIPFERDLDNVNSSALDNSILALLHRAGITAVTDDALRLLQLVRDQFGNGSFPFRGSANQTLMDILPQSCDESYTQNKAGFCVPNCMKWSLYDADVHQTEDVFLALGFAVGIISGLIVLITWIFVREMWKFPLILPFYMNISASLSAFFLCLTYVVGRPQSFCSSSDLTITLQSTTAMCNVQGTLVHFFSQASIMWWMFSTFNLFVVICRPLSKIAGHILFDRTRLHIIEFDQYYPTLGPDTIACTPRSQSLHYFTQALPIQIFLGAGLTFLIQVVFTLKRHMQWQKKRQEPNQSLEVSSSHCSPVDKGKRKSLANVQKRFVFIYITYPICLVAILLTIMIQLEDVENFENSFRYYFLCVSLHLSNDSCRSFLRYTHPELSLCALLAFISYSVFALVFSLAAKPIRMFWHEQWKKLLCEKGEYIAKDVSSWCPNPIAAEANGNKVVQMEKTGEMKNIVLNGQHNAVQFEDNGEKEEVISNSKSNSSHQDKYYESSV